MKKANSTKTHLWNHVTKFHEEPLRNANRRADQKNGPQTDNHTPNFYLTKLKWKPFALDRLKYYK